MVIGSNSANDYRSTGRKGIMNGKDGYINNHKVSALRLTWYSGVV